MLSLYSCDLNTILWLISLFLFSLYTYIIYSLRFWFLWQQLFQCMFPKLPELSTHWRILWLCSRIHKIQRQQRYNLLVHLISKELYKNSIGLVNYVFIFKKNCSVTCILGICYKFYWCDVNTNIKGSFLNRNLIESTKCDFL